MAFEVGTDRLTYKQGEDERLKPWQVFINTGCILRLMSRGEGDYAQSLPARVIARIPRPDYGIELLLFYPNSDYSRDHVVRAMDDEGFLLWTGQQSSDGINPIKFEDLNVRCGYLLGQAALPAAQIEQELSLV